MKYFDILILIGLVNICINVNGQNFLPSDRKATKETIHLYNSLKKLSATQKYLVGHQDDLAYGVNWKYKEGRSDIKDVTGDYPALYGWELSHLELGAEYNIDSVPFNEMKMFIKEGYKRGGVITISWHATNLFNQKSAWDVAEGTVTAILPGGEKHELFKKQLDKIATFLESLKGDKGEYIPVLFRPFHELTGDWFWWGTKYTSVENYKKLFRFTVEYLQKQKGLHNLLYVYNTSSNFNNEDEFLQRYPGDDVVDVVSFDTYQYNSNKDLNFEKNLSQCVSVIEKVAQQKNKLAAIAEAGLNQIPYAAWFTESIAPVLKNHQLAYILFWRNAGFKYKEKQTEFYVPYKGHSSEDDFIKFYNLPETIFQKDISKLKIY